MTDFEKDINCRRVVEMVTDYLEGALAPSVALAVDRHLDTCEGCRRYLEQMRITIGAVGRLRNDDVPADVRERLLAAFGELNYG
jgi:anti-sigma factor RsiW